MRIIVDTNVLMDGLDFKKFEKVVIPIVCVEELDHLKMDRDFNKSGKARKAIRDIEESKNSLCVFDSKPLLLKDLDPNKNDNIILSCAVDAINNDTVDFFYTKDLALKIKAKKNGIPLHEELDSMCKGYTGLKEVMFSDEELADFYEHPENTWGLLQNQYLIIRDSDGLVVDRKRWDGYNFVSLSYRNIKSEHMGELTSRNYQQDCAFDLLQNKNIPIKVLFGVFGSGKDLLMAAHALNYIQARRKLFYEKIMFIRSNVGVKNVADIGFLPGSEFDKLLPYAMPLADHVGGIEGLRMLTNATPKIVELQHLGFIRGRDIKNTIVIVSEAENLTREHAQLLVSRIGENSQIWFNGDFRQIDSNVFEQNNGLHAIIEALKGEELFGCVNFTITERSEVAKLSEKI